MFVVFLCPFPIACCHEVGRWGFPKEENYLFAGKDILDLLEGLLLGDAVGSGNLLGEGVLVALRGSKVGRGELVELGSESLLDAVVGHVVYGRLCGIDWFMNGD